MSRPTQYKGVIITITPTRPPQKGPGRCRTAVMIFEGVKVGEIVSFGTKSEIIRSAKNMINVNLDRWKREAGYMEDQLLLSRARGGKNEK